MARATRKAVPMMAVLASLVSLVAGLCWLAVQATEVDAPVKDSNDIQLASDSPKPLSPQASRKTIRLPDDLRIDLVAGEPLVKEPSAMAFDERGRLFVCEIHGYNLDGYLDIVDLNKTGKLDREVRRVRHATPASQKAAAKETYGTVKLLRDTDGDGIMDRADVFADRLPPCYGVVPWRGGAIVVCAPDIVYLADRDGDGKAEVKETLFTGFRRQYIERGISNPRWGSDNWIYVAAGGGGGTISGPRLAKSVKIGHSDFRFKPDGSAIEPVTGAESMFGLTMTDFGDRFHTTTRFVVPLPYHYLARNPYVPADGGDVVAAGSRYSQVFPISKPDPWRLARGQDPAWIKFYGERETKPNGNFTSPCGQLIYRADLLPQQYQGNYFVCDPANNLIHRCLLERDGAGFKVRRAPGEEQSEFLAATDQWFRPINLGLGPDGAIYVVDMYREIIEDFSAIPRYLQQQYVNSLIAGKDHGRIWRIGPQQANEKPKLPSLASAEVQDLVRELASGNAWRRETAQRLLIERGEKAALAPLAKLVRQGATPQARFHALGSLDGLGSLEPAHVLHTLGDASYGVRRQALQFSERWLGSQPAILDRVLKMVNDDDPVVRLQLAMTLGESRDPRALDALAHLAVHHGEERWLPGAILSSTAETAEPLLERLLKQRPPSAGAAALLRPLASSVGARRDDAQVGRLLQSMATLDKAGGEPAMVLLLDGLGEGLGRSRAGKLKPTRDARAGREAIVRLVGHSSPAVRQRAIHLAGLLQLYYVPELDRIWAEVGANAQDENRPLADRLTAASMLATAPWSHQKKLAALVAARQPQELQLSVVQALAASDDVEVAGTLLAAWSDASPKVQEALIDALFARRDRLPKMLDAIEKRVVPAGSLSPFHREQLLENSTGEVRRRAQALLAGPSDKERAAVLEKYRSALGLKRDPFRGKIIFEQECAKCHQLHGMGVAVGPDLAAARTRPDATLLSDILDPSAALTPGYTVYMVATLDGRVFTGALAAETATSITLRREKGEADTILRRNIDEMKASSRSLMPDGMERLITPQDLADLIGFLRQPPASK